MGDVGAKFALGLATKIGKATGNAIKNRASLAGLRAARQVAEPVAEGLAKAPKGLKALGAVTGIGALSRATISAAESEIRQRSKRR